MDCRKALLNMQEYLDRSLDAQQTRELRAHVESCASCASAYKTYSALAKALAGLTVYSLSEQTRARILAAYAAQRRLRAGRFWATAAIFSLASTTVAVALWFFEEGLSVDNALSLLDLLGDPARALNLARAQLAESVHLGTFWLGAAAYLKPYLVTFSAGTLLTAALITIVISAFLVISLVERSRTPESLGRYL